MKMKFVLIFFSLMFLTLFAGTTNDKQFLFDSDTGQLLVNSSATAQSDALNNIEEGSLAFGSVGAGYSTILALGTSQVYAHLLISNSLNQDIVLRFGGANEMTISASESRTMDGVILNGNIEIKHNGAAATAGTIYLNAW